MICRYTGGCREAAKRIAELEAINDELMPVVLAASEVVLRPSDEVAMRKLVSAVAALRASERHANPSDG